MRAASNGRETLTKNTKNKPAKVEPKKRTRRSKEEIVDRIIQAASEEFEHNGYAGTKTAVIAEKAGVAEWLIFNYFGTKAQLFQDAIFKPLNQQFLDFSTQHLTNPNDKETMMQQSRQYIIELQKFIESHSKMFMSLAVAQTYERDNIESKKQIEGLEDYFSKAADLAKTRRSSISGHDPKLMARMSFAATFGAVLFKDWIFPKELVPEKEFTDVLSDFILAAMNSGEIQSDV